MANLNQNTNWDKSFTLTKQNNSKYTLSTSGQYVDRNIQLTMNVRGATASLSATGSASISNLSYIYDSTNTRFNVSGSASLTGTATLTVSQSGWVGSGMTSAIAGTASLSSVTVPRIGIKSTITGTTNVTPIISRTNTTATTAINVGTQAATTNVPANGYFISVQSAAASNTITAAPSVSTAGYGTTVSGQYSATNATASVGAKASNITYIPIDAVSASLAGSATASVSGISFTQTSGANTFDVSLTGTISGSTTMTVSKAGWLASSVNASVSGSTISTTQKINRVTVGATVPETKVTPTISKIAVPSNVTDAADGNATTTTPSSGVYIAVNSSSTTAIITVSPKVTAAGYGTTNNYATSSSTGTVGANASSNTYIKIKSGTGVANTASVSIAKYTTDGSNAGINIAPIIGTAATSEPTAGYYIAFSATGEGSSKISSAGWMNAGALTAATTSITRYYPVTTATITYSGGGISGSGTANLANKGYYNGSNYNTGDIIDITSQTSVAAGYYALEATGKAYMSRAVVYRQASAGYIPDSNGVQGVLDSISNKSSSTGTATYYIKKSELGTVARTRGGSVESPDLVIEIERTNNIPLITVSKGYYPTDRYIDVGQMPEAEYNAPIAQIYNNSYFTTSNSSNYSFYIQPQFQITNSGFIGSMTLPGDIVYYKLNTTSTTYTAANVNNTTFTQGQAKWGTGWITAGNAGQASFANTATSGQSYLDISNTTGAPILASNGFLYINKGYTDNVKISLAKLIPDFENNAYVATNGHILSGYKAYDQAGNILTGTIPTKTSANFVINGGSIGVPAGYYASDQTINMTAAAATVSGTTTASAPTISRSTTAISGATNVANGNATTSTPANNTCYVAMTANAPATTISLTKTINTAGFLSTTAQITTSASTTAKTGSTYYIPIKKASVTTTAATATATGGTASISVSSNISTTSTNTGYKISATATGGSASTTTGTLTITDGYLTATQTSTLAAKSATGASSNTAVYIQAAVLGSEGTVSTTPTVTISGTTNMSTTSTGIYYFTRTGTVTNGTVQTKYKATTAGYTPVVNATNGGTVTVTPTKTADATIYIPTAAGSVTMTKGNGSCTLQSSTNITTSDSNTSGVSVTFRGSGSVSATAKITTAGYTPTNNSFASGSSTASNTADLTKYITGVTLTKGKTFSITVPNGALNSDGTNNQTITFVFTVANDNTGNVTIAGPD